MGREKIDIISSKKTYQSAIAFLYQFVNSSRYQKFYY